MAKGVNITTEFNEFKDAFFKNKIMRHKMKKIQRKNANLKHMKSTKISLSCFDDKRFVLNDEIQTLAYFHRELKNRFSQMIINKKRFSQIRRIQKDFHKTRDSHR